MTLIEATRAQALHATAFLYNHVLSLPLPPLPGGPRPRLPERRPSVFSLAECLTLRITDIDLDRQRVREPLDEVPRRQENASPLLWPLPPSAMAKATHEAIGVPQPLLGHGAPRPTKTYAQLADRAPLGVVSPRDRRRPRLPIPQRLEAPRAHSPRKPYPPAHRQGASSRIAPGRPSAPTKRTWTLAPASAPRPPHRRTSSATPSRRAHTPCGVTVTS